MDVKHQLDSGDWRPLEVPGGTGLRPSIPYNRDKHRNPIARVQLSGRPSLARHPGSLLETARAESPEEAAMRLRVSKAQSAIKAEQDAELHATALEFKCADRSMKAARLIAVLTEEQRLLQKREAEVSAGIARHLAATAIKWYPSRPNLVLLDDEPSTAEQVAGKHGLRPARSKPIVPERAQGLVPLGTGLFFGAGLGLFTGKLTLTSLEEEWPAFLFFWLIGVVVMWLVSKLFLVLGAECGAAAYAAARRSRTAAIAKAFCVLSAAAVLGPLVIAIEAKVEQLGFMKGVLESTTLQPAAFSPVEILIVSLMLALPAVASSFWFGYVEEGRVANNAHVAMLHEAERQALRNSDAYRDACHDFEVLLGVRAERSRIEADIQGLVPLTYGVPNLEESQRLEDDRAQAQRYAWDAEDAQLAYILNKPVATPESSAGRRWSLRRCFGFGA